MTPTLNQLTPQQIADSLVRVTKYNHATIWNVAFGTHPNYYGLHYDNEATANSIANALKQLVIEGIEQSNTVHTAVVDREDDD